MRVVVTEKPSVARDLARVLGASAKHDGYLEGEGIRITWCIGHLVELEDPAHYDAAWKAWRLDTLPMLPERFDLRLREGVADQFKVIKRLVNERGVEQIVNACDAGREGELIFRWVMELAGCKRPTVRLWVSSLTDEAITQAWRRLRPSAEYDALGDAARCRSESDWLVGLNATRALTCRSRDQGGDLLSVGRVQTPTLAMIVARDRQIDAFVPETYWQVKALLESPRRQGRDPDGPPWQWEAVYVATEDGKDAPKDAPKDRDVPSGEDDEAPKAERIASEDVANAIAAAAKGRTGRVVEADRKRTREQPPLLYDLTSLQRRANERYGLSAQTTLAVAQALYEKHKLITYPRTDARYITPDQVAELPKILRGLAGLAVYAPFATALLAKPIAPGKRVVDANEVGDHHAILPTGKTPSADRLSPDEKKVFDLVARRLMAALSTDALFDVTTLVVAIGDFADPGHPLLPREIRLPLRFRARGRVCRDAGWRAVDPPGRSKDVDLPPVETGDPARAEDTKVVEGKTRPPRPYSDATLLRAMETAGRELDDAELQRAMRHAGLGTPATRADILQTLLDRKYIERRGRELRALAKGCALIDAVPLAELKSAELTGRWEARLAAVAEGKEPRPRFMADVAEHVRHIVGAIATGPAPAVEAVKQPDTPVLGSCPVCGTPVREGRMTFGCETGRACAFVVWKTIAKRKVSVRMVKQLLAEGRTDVVKGFRSKAGKEFEAALEWKDGKVGFWFPPREGEDRAPGPPSRSSPPPPPSTAPSSPPERAATRSSPERATTPSSPVGLACPRCGEGSIVRGRAAWGCNRWKEGCNLLLPFQVAGRALTDADAAALLGVGRTGVVDGLRDERGDAVRGVLLLEDGRVRFERIDR